MLKLNVLILLSLTFFSCASQQVSKMTSLEGKTYQDKPIKINFNDAKATVIVFLSAYCPCSNSHTEILKDLNKKFPEFKFIGVHSNANEKRNKAVSYFKEKEFGFPIIKDSAGKIARNLGAVKTPHVFIIGKNGSLLYHGSVTDASLATESTENFLDEALLELRAGKKISHPVRKTLGCFIVLDGMEA